MVGDPMGSIPHKTGMQFITLHGHAHLHVALYNAMISERLVDMSMKVCLQDFHEMVVPPCRNIKPV
jgi:hypothetical protein